MMCSYWYIVVETDSASEVYVEVVGVNNCSGSGAAAGTERGDEVSEQEGLSKVGRSCRGLSLITRCRNPLLMYFLRRVMFSRI